jgi:hypothetical protein
MKKLTVIALLLSTVLLAPTAAAAAPPDAFAFADDGREGDPLHGLGDPFMRLRPQVFRFTVPYNAAEVPAEIERAKAIINRVKQAGVTDILVTFRQRHDQWWPETEHARDPSRPQRFVRPTPEAWRALIRAFMDLANGVHPGGGQRTIDDDVTMWSPAYQPNGGIGWLNPELESEAGGSCTPAACGATKLAGYYQQLDAELTNRQSADKLVSPEFHDHLTQYGQVVLRWHSKCPNRSSDPRKDRLCSTVRNYIQDYYDAGGRFGDFLGWQPYDGVRHMTYLSTSDFLAATNSVPLLESERNVPVILTEAGQKLTGSRWGDCHDIEGGDCTGNWTEAAQYTRVKWMVDNLAPSPFGGRITRMHYYQGSAPGRPGGESSGSHLAWDSALTRGDGTPRPAWYAWCGASRGGDVNHPDCLWDTGRWYVAPSSGAQFGAQYLWTTGHGFGSTDQFLAERGHGTTGRADALVYYRSSQAHGCWLSAGEGSTRFEHSREYDEGDCRVTGGAGSDRRLMGDFDAISGRTAKNSKIYFYNAADAQGRTGRWYRGTSLSLHGHGYGSTDQFLADVNADGEDDAVVYYSSTGCWNVALSAPSQPYVLWNPPTQWLCEPEPAFGSSKRFVDDVTGDGKADAVLFFDNVEDEEDHEGEQPGGRWLVAASTGTGFGALTQWTDGHGAWSDDQFLGDVNGDGKKDAVTYADGCWRSALSLGSGFADSAQWLCEHGRSSTTRLLGDVTGDGKADAVTVFSYPTSWDYGGPNRSVDTESELMTVWNLLEDEIDYEARAALRDGLTPADRDRVDAFFPTSRRYGGSIDTEAEAEAVEAELRAERVTNKVWNGLTVGDQDVMLARVSAAASAESQQPPQSPGNEAERRYCRNLFRLVMCDIARRLANEAVDSQLSRFPDLSQENREGGRHEAYRHCTWSGHMVLVFPTDDGGPGRPQAKKFGDLHEDTYPNARWDKLMAYHNNRVGRDYGAEVFNPIFQGQEYEPHKEEIRDRCEAEARKPRAGELWTRSEVPPFTLHRGPRPGG